MLLATNQCPVVVISTYNSDMYTFNCCSYAYDDHNPNSGGVGVGAVFFIVLLVSMVLLIIVKCRKKHELNNNTSCKLYEQYS